MKVLVAGGAGFIGSHLVERLLDEGHHVDVVDDLSSGSLANLAAARSARTGRLTIHQVDVRDAGLAELIGRRAPEVVYHLAAHDDGAGAVDRAVHDAEVNVVGSLNLIDAARRAGAQKVVYAAAGTSLYQVPAAPSELPIRERHPQRPPTPHGVAQKAVIEYLVTYRERHALEFTALVLADVYGPRQRTGWVKALLDGASPQALAGSMDHSRDLVHVDDTVDALVRAAGRGGGLVVNVGTGVETTMRELTAELRSAGGAVATADGAPGGWSTWSGEPERFALDPGRARIHLGWSSWTTVAVGLRQLASGSD